MTDEAECVRGYADWDGWACLDDAVRVWDELVAHEEVSVSVADEVAPRADVLFAYMRSSLVESAEAFISQSMLVAMRTALTEATGKANGLLNEYNGEGDGNDRNTHVEWCKGSLDQLAESLRSLPTPSVADAFADFRNEIQRLRALTTRRLNDVESELASSQEKFADEWESTSTKFRDDAAALDTKIADREERWGTVQSDIAGRFDEFQQSVGALGEQIKSLISDGETRIAAAVAAADDAAKEQRDEALDEWASKFNEISKEHAELIRKSEQIQATAEEKLSTASAAAHASWYTDRSDDEGKRAVVYQCAGAICLVIAAGVLAWIFKANHLEDLSTGKAVASVLARLAISSAFSGLAWYLLAQATRHRNREELLTEKSLVMGTFPTFISDLDRNEQKSLKTEMARSPMFFPEYSSAVPSDVQE